ncbi:cupin domain-containing protein [Thermodesulfobacteriota bacterium]
MKSFDIGKMAVAEGGEYVLGAKDLHSDTCYMVYGVLEPQEKDRHMRPGQGHEEILCAVTGPIVLNVPAGDIRLEPGQAVHIKEDESFSVSNPSNGPVVYIVAGGPKGPDE